MSFFNLGQDSELQFTALVGADLLADGDDNLNVGDSFTMAFGASASFTVTDNDTGLSGDVWNDEAGDDRSGQIADISIGDQLVHEGAKIYAEQIYFLRAADGSLYIAVEIEVAGAADTDRDDFYAFIGNVPPGGMELTVIGETNVIGNWIKYRALSAGLDWSLDAAGAVTIEAEDMNLHNYRVDDVDAASGGEVIKLKRGEGEATVAFGTESGVYDLTVAYIDENDGEGEIEVVVDGVVVATIVLDQNTDGNGGDNSSISTFTIAGLDIDQGDEILLRGSKDGGEFARIDAITFMQANGQPDAADDAYGLNEGGNLAVNVLDNDSDPNGDPLTVISAGGVAADTVFSVGTTGGRTVQAIVAADGSLNVSAPAGQFDPLALGETDTFSFVYEASDGMGNVDEATVTVTINGLNDAPEVSGPLSVLTDEDAAAFGVDLLQGASDVDNGAVLSVANLTLLEGDASGVTLNGTVLEVDPDAYGALADLESEVIRFSYNVTDEHGAAVGQTVTITIDGLNDAPEIENPIVVDVTEDDADFVVDLLAGASDDEGSGLTVQNLNLESGDISGVVVNGATLEVAPGAYNSLPDGLSAQIVYTYDIEDGAGAVTPQTATVTIAGVNDAPTAADETLVFEEDGDPIGGANVLANESDPDAGDSVFVATAGGMAVGAALNVTSAGGRSGTATFQADGSVAFDPSGFGDLAVGESDSVEIAYTVTDNNGGFDDAVVTIQVEGQNAAPTADPNEFTGDEDTAILGQVVASDPDINDVLSYVLEVQASFGTVTFDASGDGSFSYSATLPNFNGVDVFQYRVMDPHGGEDVGTVTINVTPVNDDPEAVDQSLSTEVDTPLLGDLDATDVDGDDLTFSLLGAASNGVATVDGDGGFEYAPDAGFFGEDSFTYLVDDGNGGTDEATVTISIAEPNLPPDAIDIAIETDENTAFSGSLSATDPNLGDTLTFSLATGSLQANITVLSDGSFTYSPFSFRDFNGPDSFKFTVSDGNGGTDTGTVSVLVNPVNDDPEANPLSISGPEDTVLSGQVTASDVDGDVPTYSVDAGPSFGGLVFNLDGSFDYTPNLDFNGVDSFTYIADDGNGGTDTATVTLNVTPVDDAPAALAAPGPNVIEGTSDSETLTGTAGDDMMTGGGGDDVFVFTFNDASANGDGADVITDFDAGVGAGDVIQLVGFGVASLAELTVAPNLSADAVISLADGASITLTGVAPGALAEDDFNFV